MSTGEGWYGNQTTGGVQCPVCRITYPLGVIHTCGGSLPVGNLPALSFTPQGWECPKCGRVNAPFVASCACYALGSGRLTITTGDTAPPPAESE